MTESKKFALPSPEQEDLEESLGFLWHRTETKSLSKADIAETLAREISPNAYKTLTDRRLAVEDGASLRLTPEGERLAKEVSRRHRLAQRLLADVLNVEATAVDSNVCRLEHILSPEATDAICTLLGHPTEDPLGRAIPGGACCDRSDDRLAPLVISLDQLSPGDEGKIAYLRLAAHPELHKLLSLGLVPGTTVRLHQTRPAFVLEAGESQIALDEDVAKHIFVRKG
jgi:DtxR family transcriptional regulator, Mn-dependent transcriptional regulator